MWVYHTRKLVSKNPCPEKDVDPPTKKQSNADIVVKVMGKKGKSDLNRSCETVSLEGERSPKGGRTFALKYWCRRGLGTNVRPCAPGEGANNRSMVGERSLPQCV
jgi:hypothetical protein